MGPLGWQETVFIFLLALVVFGPRKLPELGKTVGKALTEFRRASSELKETFHREMNDIEKENESLKEVTQSYQNQIYNYDDSSYYDGSYGSDYGSESSSTDSSTVSASATQGAESTTSEGEGAVAVAENTPDPDVPAVKGEEVAADDSAAKPAGSEVKA